MVAIHLDANYIFAEPMRNRTEGEMIRVYQKIINRMKAAGKPVKSQEIWELTVEEMTIGDESPKVTSPEASTD